MAPEAVGCGKSLFTQPSRPLTRRLISGVGAPIEASRRTGVIHRDYRLRSIRAARHYSRSCRRILVFRHLLYLSEWESSSCVRDFRERKRVERHGLRSSARAGLPFARENPSHIRLPRRQGLHVRQRGGCVYAAARLVLSSLQLRRATQCGSAQWSQTTIMAPEAVVGCGKSLFTRSSRRLRRGLTQALKL